VAANVFADAGAVVFGSWCPKAKAKFTDLDLITTETVSKIIKATAERCTQKTGSDQDMQLVHHLLTGNNTYTKNVADALTEAKSCGCKKTTCFWCKPGQDVAVIGPAPKQ
jgi:hypothetical protein